MNQSRRRPEGEADEGKDDSEKRHEHGYRQPDADQHPAHREPNVAGHHHAPRAGRVVPRGDGTADRIALQSGLRPLAAGGRFGPIEVRPLLVNRTAGVVAEPDARVADLFALLPPDLQVRFEYCGFSLNVDVLCPVRWDEEVGHAP